MARIVGINHLAVEVRDIDEMLEFLERIFDDVPLRGRAGNMAFVDMGDQFIALERVKKDQTPGPASGGHVGLVVDDREETVRRAREAGRRWSAATTSSIRRGIAGRSSTTATSVLQDHACSRAWGLGARQVGASARGAAREGPR